MKTGKQIWKIKHVPLEHLSLKSPDFRVKLRLSLLFYCESPPRPHQVQTRAGPQALSNVDRGDPVSGVATRSPAQTECDSSCPTPTSPWVVP